MARTSFFLAAATIMALFAAMSCRSLNPQSKQKIHAGRLITTNSQNKVEAVFKSFTGNTACTGTAVSTNTAITAAHCVYNAGDQVDTQTGRISNKKYCVYNAVYNNLCSSDIYIDPSYISLAKQFGSGHDVAWVVFPSQTFTSYFSMFADNVKGGDEVLMVGYSEEYLSDKSKGSKRFGFNTIKNLANNATNDIATSFQNSFRSVGVDPGDSGGPLFIDCRVAGVASVRQQYTAPDQSIIPTGSQHTNLNHSSIVNLLRGASGAYFCGLSGVDESFCPQTARYEKTADYGPDAQEFPCDVPLNSEDGHEKKSRDRVPPPINEKPDANHNNNQTPNDPPAPVTLDCNKDYSAIRKGSSGICLNRSSGFCYRYGSGDVQYQLGRVECPR